MTPTVFLVRYTRRDPVADDHLYDVVERLQAIALADPQIEWSGPAFAVDTNRHAIEVMFSVDGESLSDQLVKAADVQKALIAALGHADAIQAAWFN